MADEPTCIETIVIGGGQAGLAVGYQLARRKLPFLILDARERIGEAWRSRWDSLRLFTPARYTRLPGMPFPGRGDAYPTKEELADYLESYAKRFELPVRLRTRVDRVARQGYGFVVAAGDERFECERVIVAMANYQVPRVPAFARELDPGIVQLHSQAYRNAAQLRKGSALVVGAGNSGADIALELAGTHATLMSGKESGHIPFRIESPLARHVLTRGVRFVGHHVLSVGNPLGRKVRPQILARSAPFVRVKPKDLLAAGVERVARVVGVKDGKPLLADGRVVAVDNVIWCTGYQHGFPWIDLPIFDAHGDPRHERGIVPEVPGLYFVGLHFLYALSSATLLGINRDAERIVRAAAADAAATRVAVV